MAMHRSARGWRLELALAAVVIVLGMFFLATSLPHDRPPAGLHALIGAVTVVGLVLFRRSHPVALTLLLTPVAIVMQLPMAAYPVALCAVALHRPARTAVLLAGLHAVTVAAVYRLSDLDAREYLEAVTFLVSIDVAVVAVAMLVRSQRQLVRSWADRAREAEEGQRLRVEEARHGERERIAREMHDVLAHRISLLAVHAGALEVRRDAPAQERQAAGIIRQCAYEALEDLRGVLGMLRGPAEPADEQRPQPTFADLPALVEQTRLAGTQVTLTNQVPPDSVAPNVGRHAYRIVQEALTNARKHAPGAAVRVAVTVPAQGGLRLEVINPVALVPAAAGPATPRPLPGAGAGLLGLGERVRLLGGQLEHGITASGDFRLSARLP